MYNTVKPVIVMINEHLGDVYTKSVHRESLFTIHRFDIRVTYIVKIEGQFF